MMPIGLSGSVTEVTTEQCQYKKDERTAVIFANRKLLRQFHSQCTNPKNFQMAGDKQQKTNYDKILLLTVGQAKGLEFETVYVHSDGMSDNEKYVAFTRALMNLIVVTTPANATIGERQYTSNQELVQNETNNKNLEKIDPALELKRLLIQYNELCASHRAQEDQLMKQIIELQNTMIDKIEASCSLQSLVCDE